MPHQVVQAAHAPAAIGPYSQAIIVEGSFRQIFTSGQIPINPDTGDLYEGNIDFLAHKVIDHLEAILKEAGATLGDVVRVDIFLTDLKRDFAELNKAYMTRFKGPSFPVRQTVGVLELPKNASVEMSCIAVVAH